MGNMKLTEKCQICNGDLFSSLTVKEQMYGLEDSFSYSECKACGCLSLVNRPIHMDKYYPGDYYSLNAEVEHKSSFKETRRNLKRRFVLTHPRRLTPAVSTWLKTYNIYWIYRSIGVTLDTRILDVGAGSGTHVKELRQIGVMNCLGVEPFINQDIFFKNDPAVIKGTIENITGTWDLITFHHSLEHIADQRTTLSKAAQLLADQGQVLIRIPTVTSYAYEKYKEHWFNLDAPRHLYLHSHKSIRLLIESAGLRVTKLWCDSDENGLLYSEQYRLGIPLFSKLSFLNNRKLFPKNSIREFRKKAITQNAMLQGDSICVVCERA